MQKANRLIRDALYHADMRNWQLAKLLNIGEATLCRLLREDLPEEKQKEIVEKINQAAEARKNESEC